jgi:hypothetical protein
LLEIKGYEVFRVDSYGSFSESDLKTIEETASCAISIHSSFLTIRLFAPHNGTVVSSLFISALSVSGAILLILEMYTPYAGLIQVSSAPLRAVLAHLGQ